jgi:hypothetical protein
MLALASPFRRNLLFEICSPVDFEATETPGN